MFYQTPIKYRDDINPTYLKKMSANLRSISEIMCMVCFIMCTWFFMIISESTTMLFVFMMISTALYMMTTTMDFDWIKLRTKALFEIWYYWMVLSYFSFAQSMHLISGYTFLHIIVTLLQFGISMIVTLNRVNKKKRLFVLISICMALSMIPFKDSISFANQWKSVIRVTMASVLHCVVSARDAYIDISKSSNVDELSDEAVTHSGEKQLDETSIEYTRIIAILTYVLFGKFECSVILFIVQSALLWVAVLKVIVDKSSEAIRITKNRESKVLRQQIIQRTLTTREHPIAINTEEIAVESITELGPISVIQTPKPVQQQTEESPSAEQTVTNEPWEEYNLVV